MQANDATDVTNVYEITLTDVAMERVSNAALEVMRMHRSHGSQVNSPGALVARIGEYVHLCALLGHAVRMRTLNQRFFRALHKAGLSLSMATGILIKQGSIVSFQRGSTTVVYSKRVWDERCAAYENPAEQDEMRNLAIDGAE